MTRVGFHTESTNQEELASPLARLVEEADGTSLSTRVSHTLLDFRPDLMVSFQDQSEESRRLIRRQRALGATIWLVQDGFLSFRVSEHKRMLWPLIHPLHMERWAPRRLRVLANRFLYNNVFFGQTRPDRVYVWDEQMMNRVATQFGLTNIEVSGPRTRCAPPDQTGDASTKRVLIVDQCMVAHRRISERIWKREFDRFVRAVAPFRPRFRFHPAEVANVRDYIETRYSSELEFAPIDETLTTSLAQASVMVTFTSSSFVCAKEMGVPVIFYEMPGFRDRLCVHGARSLRELVGRIATRHGNELPRLSERTNSLERDLVAFVENGTDT